MAAITTLDFENVPGANAENRASMPASHGGLLWDGWSIEPFVFFAGFGNDEFDPGEDNLFYLVNVASGTSTSPEVSIGADASFFLHSVDLSGFLVDNQPFQSSQLTTAPEVRVDGFLDGVLVETATIPLIDAASSAHPLHLVTADLLGLGWRSALDELVFSVPGELQSPRFLMDNLVLSDTAVIPLPATLPLLAIALVIPMALGRRR